MIKLVVLIVSLLISGTAFALDKEEWMYIASSNYTDNFVNTKRILVIDRDSQTIEVWRKEVMTGLKKGDLSKVGDYMISKEEYQCINQRSKMVRILAYKKSGESEGQEFANKYADWIDVVPGSVGESNLSAVCNYIFPKLPS